MLVACFNDIEKDDIVDRYVNQEMAQQDIANAYARSRRTIQRVLQERGILNGKERVQCNVSDIELIAIVRKHGFMNHPEALDDALYMPALTKNNVMVYLARLSNREFSELVSVVNKARDLEKQTRQKKVAVHG